ncbi:MAG TPA: hypothetical protein VFR81_01240 [Longimicrobium sp.]|nr:hypothetical protein [Longimicrobium sp.]
MTDSAAGSDAPGRLPSPTFFDPSFERLPAPAAFDEGRPGPVLLLFDPRSDRQWVADAAIAIATAWNAGGRRTVLADLSLEDPVLHERIGMGNMDGVVDIFLYGASLARSARPVPGRGFYLITAGTYTPEPESIFRHPRWEKLIAGFRDAQASLLLFAPADAEGVAAMGAWAPETIFLGERGSAAPFEKSIVQGGLAPRAWLTPPVRDGVAPPAPPPAERFPEPEPVPVWSAPAREPTVIEARPAGQETVVDAPAAAALPVPDPTWEEELPPRRRAQKERKVSPLMLVLLVILLIALAVVVALQFFPDVLQGGQAAAPARIDRPAAARPAVPARPRAEARPAGTALPYAVFVKSFDASPPARTLAAEVAREIPGTPVYVFPEETQGRLYHKVYAGMSGDTVEAARLREQLVAGGSVDPEDAGGRSALVQPRPLAFDLGDFPSQEAARARADSLAAREVSAYPAAVPLTDGTERWKLYGGAFADSASAAPMQRQLQTAGLPARLVPRTGRPPASPK